MSETRDPLSEALRQWQAEKPSEGRLSDGCRARILDAARHPRTTIRSRPPRPLFLPLRGWALVGALPAALLVLALGYGLWPAPAPPAAGPGASPTVVASRVGDEVVFRIANGGRPHQVVRSGKADDASDGEALAVTDGEFRDRVDAGGNLVFYRID